MCNRSDDLLRHYPDGNSVAGLSYAQRAEKIMDRIKELASYSDDKHNITRTFGSPAFISGCNRVKLWMEKAGLQTRIDNIGNVRGRLNSVVPNARTLVIASHIDTVVNAGKFDGPLGVIMAIDAVEHLIEQKQSLPFNIEVIAFSDEEGVRFHTTYLGSRVVTGTFPVQLLEMKDEGGMTLKQVVETMNGNTDLLPDDAISKEEWLGYYEIHIEQGPALEERKIPVAVVTGIAGQQRAEIAFKGMAGHAGTVPMHMRRDALCAASDFILEVEKYALVNTKDIVATVGKLYIPHAASNVIPGAVVCSLDIRSINDQILNLAHQTIKRICSEVCARRKIEFEWKQIQGMPAVQCDPRLTMLLKKAIGESGNKMLELVSGAGHDAVPISAVAPVSMLFVKCYKGISHHPLENVKLNDIAAAAEVTDHFIQQLASEFAKQ